MSTPQNYQDHLDSESRFDRHLFEKTGLGASTEKSGFLELGLQGPGTFQMLKAPNLDELDGTIDMDDID